MAAKSINLKNPWLHGKRLRDRDHWSLGGAPVCLNQAQQTFPLQRRPMPISCINNVDNLANPGTLTNWQVNELVMIMNSPLNHSKNIGPSGITESRIQEGLKLALSAYNFHFIGPLLRSYVHLCNKNITKNIALIYYAAW